MRSRVLSRQMRRRAELVPCPPVCGMEAVKQMSRHTCCAKGSHSHATLTSSMPIALPRPLRPLVLSQLEVTVSLVSEQQLSFVFNH